MIAMTNNEYLKEFVTYPLALRMKALGFNEPCIAFATIEYKDVIHCGIGFKVHKESDLPTKPFGVPTRQSAFDWFRENYNLHSKVNHQNGFYWCEIESYNIPCVKTWNISSDLINEYKSYKEAELNCLELLLEITESKSE